MNGERPRVGGAPTGAQTVAVLRDVLARTVAIRESLACGDSFEAAQLAEDLELDLVAWIEGFARVGG